MHKTCWLRLSEGRYDANTFPYKIIADYGLTNENSSINGEYKNNSFDPQSSFREYSSVIINCELSHSKPLQKLMRLSWSLSNF